MRAGLDGTDARAVIPPPPRDNASRPRWSVMIPTYHCAGYLRQTLASVLAQDPGPDVMQIEVVDDHSVNDDPRAVVAELASDGRVGFHRQPANVGHVRNFDSCVARARGELVHILHGDDCVLPGFYETMERPFALHPEIGAAFCRHAFIDGDGRWQAVAPLLQPVSGIVDGWLERIALGQLVQPPTIVVRRAVYERLGGFDQRIAAYGEDWEMWVRIAAAYPVWHQVEPLAAYRVQGGSLSGRAMRTGQNLRDLRTAVAINRALLPAQSAPRISRAALANNALGAIRRAHRMLDAGELGTPLVQLGWAARISPTPRVAWRGVGLLLHWGRAAARRALRR